MSPFDQRLIFYITRCAKATVLGVGLTLGLAGPAVASGKAKKPGKPPIPVPTESKNEAKTDDLGSDHSGSGSGDDEIAITRSKNGRFHFRPKHLPRLFRLGPGPDRARVGQPKDEGAEPLRGPFVGKRPPIKDIVAGADLSGTNHSSMDLSHLDLTGTILVGAILRGTILRSTVLVDADLSGADLRGALMQGAKLAGARLFQTKIDGAVGLDLTGAALHPFFEPGDAPGTINLYELPEPQFHPQQILSGANGELFLLEPGKVEYWEVMPTGSATAIKLRTTDKNSDGAKRLMVKGPGKRISFFEHGNMVTIEDHSFGAKVAASELQWDTHYNGVTSAVAIGPNSLWATLPGFCLAYILPDQPGKLVQTRTTTIPGMTLQDLTASTDGSVLVALDHKGNQIVWFPNMWQSGIEPEARTGVPIDALPLPGIGRIRALARGPGDRFWFLLPDLNGVGYLQVQGHRASYRFAFLPPDPKFASRRLHNLVQGPDDSMWFTQQTPPGIGRIDPNGNWRVVSIHHHPMAEPNPANLT